MNRVIYLAVCFILLNTTACRAKPPVFQPVVKEELTLTVSSKKSGTLSAEFCFTAVGNDPANYFRNATPYPALILCEGKWNQLNLAQGGKQLERTSCMLENREESFLHAVHGIFYAVYVRRTGKETVAVKGFFRVANLGLFVPFESPEVRIGVPHLIFRRER